MHPHIFKGGAEFQLLHLAKELQMKGHCVDVLALSVSNDIREDMANLNFITNKDNLAPRKELLNTESIIDEIKNMIRLKRMLARLEETYDVINPHNFPAVWSCTGHNPIVWMCNEPPDPLWANPNPSITMKIARSIGVAVDNRIVMKHVKRIAVIDELNQKRVRDRYHMDSDVVYSGVDFDYFSKGNAKDAIAKFNLDGKFVVVHVGWFTPQKNQMASVKSIESVISQIPELMLVLVGRNDNAYGKMIRVYLSTSVARNNVLLTGLVSMDDIRNLYAASNITIFPTRSQTWGASPLEGLCLGKIPIVSREAGVSFLIEKERMGVVSGDLAAAIIEIHSNYAEYRRMAQRGRDFVKEHLSWNDYCDRMVSIFEKVINSA